MKKLIIILIMAFTAGLLYADKENIPGKHYVPYRGMRQAMENECFKIMSVSAFKNYNHENALMEINVKFSVPVDPLSFNGETVIINGRNSDSNVFFNFGRKGERVRITIINAREEFYTVRFSGVKSYKGEFLEETEIENIQHGTEIIKGRQ